MELTGRTALITGASRGIGEGIARAFAAAGADLILVARTEARLKTLANELHATGRAVTIVAADLVQRADVDRVIAAGENADVLVNNAAVGQKFNRITEWSEAYWREVFEVGFFAPSLLIRALGKSMSARGRGVIINISSIAGLRARPFLAHYCAAKMGMDAVMRAAAMELGRHGVRAVSIAPGAIDTQHHGVTNSRATDSPVQRIGLPADVAELAVFLASDRASFITGEVIACDGGLASGEYSRYDLYEPYLTKG